MKTNKQSGFGLMEVIVIVAVVALLATVGWLTFSNLNKNEAKNATDNSSQQTARQENEVLNESAGSPELVAFLKADYAGCDKMVDREPSRGTYKIIKEVDGFAKLGYGCGETKASMITKNVKGKWELISPTNQFTPNGIPSCAMVEEHKIPKEIASQCAVDPLVDEDETNPKNVRAVTH